MRHGFDDANAWGADATPDDLRRFATQSIRRLAEMLDPAWLAGQQKNAAFYLGQQIDVARMDLRAGSIDDDARADGWKVIKQARTLLDTIK
jgi:hypothetical protein